MLGSQIGHFHADLLQRNVFRILGAAPVARGAHGGAKFVRLFLDRNLERLGFPVPDHGELRSFVQGQSGHHLLEISTSSDRLAVNRGDDIAFLEAGFRGG